MHLYAVAITENLTRRISALGYSVINGQLLFLNEAIYLKFSLANEFIKVLPVDVLCQTVQQPAIKPQRYRSQNSSCGQVVSKCVSVQCVGNHNSSCIAKVWWKNEWYHVIVLYRHLLKLLWSLKLKNFITKICF